MTVIREITEADIDAVARIHVRTWRSAYAGIIPAEVLAALDPAENAARRRKTPRIPGTHTMVADTAGVIGGFASFGPDRDREPTGELYAVYVDPDQQSRGFGQLLYRTAVDTLTAAGFPEMRLWVLEENHAARGFYERMGMAPDGVVETYTPRGSTVELPELRYAVRL